MSLSLGNMNGVALYLLPFLSLLFYSRRSDWR